MSTGHGVQQQRQPTIKSHNKRAPVGNARLGNTLTLLLPTANTTRIGKEGGGCYKLKDTGSL